MTERQGFEEWYTAAFLEDEVEPTDEYLFDVWQRACEWQRQKDIELCLEVGKEGAGMPGEIWAERCAKSIEKQEMVDF